MRVGTNPLKTIKETIEAPRISCGVVTHYTDNNYHADRMTIVRRCLNSITAAHPDEFIIWDNGSTPDFRLMLREYSPDVLIESVNVGLDRAKHNLFELARGDIFCYSDDDVFHEVGWLAAQLEILETYPNVGVVSGSPQRSHFEWACDSNAVLSSKYNMAVTKGRLIPDEYEREYCLSIGCKCGRHEKAYIGREDVLLEYKGVKAWAHGHHFQFTCYREAMKPYFTANNYYMHPAKDIDVNIDKAGFMRLTTYKRTVYHMGNKL